MTEAQEDDDRTLLRVTRRVNRKARKESLAVGSKFCPYHCVAPLAQKDRAERVGL